MTTSDGPTPNQPRTFNTVLQFRAYTTCLTAVVALRTMEELHAQGTRIRVLAEGLDTEDDNPTSRLTLHIPAFLNQSQGEMRRKMG